MTAGKGVQHSEMFPLIHKNKGNPLELFQLWLNLPKASKFVDPHFKMLWEDSIPALLEKDNKGKMMHIEGEVIPAYHSIHIKSDKDISLQADNEDCFILVLQGKPINEPLVQYGPFVMNTDKEIREAYADYQRTQFGGWPWPKQEQTHDRHRGRFAKHANGTEETKPNL